MITTPVSLSGAANGLPVVVAATSIGSGTTIHTATASTTGWDELYLWVTNVDTVARLLTIGWGGVTDPTHLICKNLSIPANSGPVNVVAGMRLQNGLIVKAAGDATNILTISGIVNRMV